MSNTTTTSRLQFTQCNDPAAWDEFLVQNDGHPFALWGWAEGCRRYGHEQYYLVARDGGSIVAGLPLVHIESRLFGSKLVSPPFGERGSVVLDGRAPEGTTNELLERAKRLADELNVDFVSLRGADLGETEYFEKKNRFTTFRIPVGEGTDLLWDGVKDSRQRQINQARDGSLEYRIGDSLSDLRTYYDLYLESMRGHGSPPHSFEFFRTLWEHLHDEGRLHLGMILRDGDLINGIIDLSLGSTVYQWGVVTDYEHRELNGGSLLLWKSMKRASEEGYDTYELGRTREGSGVYMFKKSFGGEKTWYDDYHYFPNEGTELPHPEKAAYEPIKRVWKRLPIAVTRTVGPSIRGSISL